SWLDRSASSGQQIKDEHDRRNNEQQVDQAAANVRQQTDQPQHNQYPNDRPNHLLAPSRVPEAACRDSAGGRIATQRTAILPRVRTERSASPCTPASQVFLR